MKTTGSPAQKQFKTLEFKVSDASEHDNIGVVEGYASNFGNVDLGDDVVEKGAFAKTISDKNGIFPILLDHNPAKPIGWNTQAKEDATGLKIKGEIQLITEEARNRYALAKRARELGTKMGLSIGYTPVKWEMDAKTGVRRLKEVKLWEYSLVTFPMNELSGISQAKGLVDFLRTVQNNGYSIFEIEKALAELKTLSDARGAAAQETDPEILQSVDKLIQKLRG